MTISATFEGSGAQIAYDVTGDLAAGVPLLLIGCPMDANGFRALGAEFPERPVVTYDPRGMARSIRQNVDARLSPEDHIEDLHQLVEVLGAGPVDVFASSGGAVNALAWVSRFPDDVRTLVAHEPPSPSVLPDREALLACVDDIADTYEARGYGAGMAKFIVLVGHAGELPRGFELPDVDPAQFGLPTGDDGSRGDALLEQNMRGINHYVQDLDALRDVDVRVVLARGESSGDVMAARSAAAMAEQTGRDLVDFPGDHTGFVPAEWQMGGDPLAFAERLRRVLDDAASR